MRENGKTITVVLHDVKFHGKDIFMANFKLLKQLFLKKDVNCMDRSCQFSDQIIN